MCENMGNYNKKFFFFCAFWNHATLAVFFVLYVSLVPGILNFQKPNLSFHFANFRLNIERIFLRRQLFPIYLLHFNFHITNKFSLKSNIRLEKCFLFL